MTDTDQKNGAEPQFPKLTAAASVAVSKVVTPLLIEHDPRAIVQGLLMNAVKLSQKIIEAKRWTAQEIVGEFTAALNAAIDAQPEEARIQIADATALRKQ
jgi:hypothetical protein